MISNHLNLVEQQRQSAEALSDQVAHYLAAGGQIAQLKSPPRNPLPSPRSNKIDPDTILKRRRKSPTLSERRTLRKMADAL
ncbi:hypothetical protein [Pseudomonas sp.]|uniref:hypothetical protein n=1 Tax=Pseudomonas sp. TaxID=306 RepID=UPI002625DB78|nr:hypothetical protein [Pseudomonas sp.]